MKTLIALTTAMALAASVFAMKIPTGDNIRVADIKQNGDGATVEVTLGSENTGITTPVGAVQAKAGSVVYFYDKGALKELTAVDQDVTTLIGTLKVKDGGKLTFYESGALATLSPADQTVDLPPLKGVRVANSEVMSFYENGKVKTLCFSKEKHEIETPLGNIPIKDAYGSGLKYVSHIDYYESGSPKALYVKAYKIITVGGTGYGCYGYDGDDKFYPIEFYDSGSSDKWLVKSLVPGCYTNDGTEIVSVAHESKIGKIDIALNPYHSYTPVRMTFDKDGNVLSAMLYKSPDFTVKVNGEEAYIKGGEYKKVYWDRYGNRKERDADCTISFYDDAATIKSCVLDELVMAEIDGIKFTLPAGEDLFFWENGNIKQCYSSNPTKVKVKGAEYSIDAEDRCLFHRDGTLRAISAGNGFFIDTFYSEGEPKRIIRYQDVYDAKSDQGYVAAFITTKNYRVNISSDHLFATNTYESFYLQKGDLGRNISMVFFDDNDNPSSYTMLKTDKDGNYILDDEGVPIEDPKKKKFIKE